MNKLDKDYIGKYCTMKDKKILTADTVAASSSHCVALYTLVMNVMKQYQLIKDTARKNDDIKKTRELYGSDGKNEDSDRASANAVKMENKSKDQENLVFLAQILPSQMFPQKRCAWPETSKN